MRRRDFLKATLGALACGDLLRSCQPQEDRAHLPSINPHGRTRWVNHGTFTYNNPHSRPQWVNNTFQYKADYPPWEEVSPGFQKFLENVQATDSRRAGAAPRGFDGIRR